MIRIVLLAGQNKTQCQASLFIDPRVIIKKSMACHLFISHSSSHMRDNASRPIQPQNDEYQFQKICLDCYPVIYRLAFRLLGDREEASDISQEAMLRFFRACGKQGVPVEQPRAWLCRAAANLCLDHCRRRSRFRRLFFTPEQLPAAAASAEETLQGKEEERKVRAALALLGGRDRLLLALYQEECRYADMARVTGLKEASVGKALSRALARLERRLFQGERS